MTYPLLMNPYFRCDGETPWGGDALRTMFGKDTPSERTGESLEISALAGRESVARNGELAGRALSEIAALWGSALTGEGAGETFPLLLKLLDARESLSVQVHPGDDYALVNEGKLGKTEAWLILHAEPDAEMVYGVRTDDLRGEVERGTLEAALRRVRVKPGQVYYMPHGMIHALGAGIVAYEIQQSSDVTYRFWDWNRVGADGKPRALHTEKALAVARPELRLDALPGATLLCEGGSQTYFISDGHFELSRLNLAGEMPLGKGRMRLLTALSECALRWEGGEETLRPMDSALVPAALSCALAGRGVALCACLCEQERLRARLGYRASLVAGLTESLS